MRVFGQKLHGGNKGALFVCVSVLLDPADEKLLEEEIQAPSSSKRSQQHAKVVPWMRKTEYISTEFNRYGVSNEKVEVKIGVSVKQQFTEEEIYKDRDSQIAAIEKTFEDAQKSIAQHYSKPRVMPVEVLPVFPDFKMWINPCAQVIFDSDPAPKDVSAPAGVDMMSQAMIRCSEREDEERPADEDEEEEEEEVKRRERKSSGSESGEDRQARDEEEIFGSDDDSEEDEGERARSNSSSVQHSGSERASDSSDASDSE
uniref:RNA polymerase II-associated factor 1 homolog n=1 Tax=Cyprinus carpio TaxID=7962 RepID=A0A8C1QF68_CYPCA